LTGSQICIKEVCKISNRSVHKFLSYRGHRLQKSRFEKNAFKVYSKKI